jgi:hypothetical protein
MKYGKPRRPRKYTEAQIQAVRAWKKFGDLCKELGLTRDAGRYLRDHYFKTPPLQQ